ncbi:cation:proton antiporter [Thiohalorhabdus sp.]|uniref:cation:proton antiporter n=1 Tax=Thiohalorhabdus sp. TaxID=3094134 RepID=UPI002FC2EEBC
MDIPHTIGLMTTLLLVALLVEPLARRLHLPFSAVLVICGFVGSEAVVAAGGDTGLRWHHFHDLILFALLPVIIFQSALTLDLRQLRANLVPTLFLALPVTLVSAAIVAVLVYYGIGHPSGFPWMAAALTGILLSATDPVAVLDLFHRLGAPRRLTVLMEGESLFNDALAIVAFGLLLEMALGQIGDASALMALGRFLLVFLGGALVGFVVGVAFVGLMRWVSGSMRQAVASLIGSYLAFWLAQHALGLSGVMSVLAAGLIIGHWRRKQRGGGLPGLVEELWSGADYLANAVVFLLVGVTITLDMFSERWLAMLIGISAVLLARAMGVLAGLGLAGRLPGSQPVPLAQQAVVFWGGQRGAVTLALALSLPLALDYWWTIQSIAYGVVLFTLFVQAPSIPPLLRWAVRATNRPSH